MKKLIFPFLFFALIFASCKKETPQPTKPAPEAGIAQQVANIIHKGNPDLYNRLYNHPDQKTPVPVIWITHGIFHYPTGSPESGTCIWDPNCVCHVTVVFGKLVDPETDTKDLTTDYSEEFEDGDCQLLINDSVSTTIEHIKSVDIAFDRTGASTIDWSVF
jgi:hypothetical protein